MRCATYHEFGDPTKVLHLEERFLPQPGPGEVRIKTVLASIHNHDLWTVRGQYGDKPALPAIGGSEGLGIVDVIGEGVEKVTVGQRVAASSVYGTWAEYFLAPSRMVLPMPETITDETAVQLLAMPLSALMLLEFLNLKEGQWIIQNAANGAVGKTLATVALSRGVQVINLVRRDTAIEELAALDIQRTVSTAQVNWQDQVRSLTGGAPIRGAVDSVGGKSSNELLSLLGEGGVLVAFGAMGREPMQLSAGELIYKQATVQGFWGSKISRSMQIEDKRRLAGELLALATAGKLHLPVEATFDLADVAKAAAASVQGERSGKSLVACLMESRHSDRLMLVENDHARADNRMSISTSDGEAAVRVLRELECASSEATRSIGS